MLLDNTLQGGHVVGDVTGDEDVAAIRSLNDAIAADPRVKVTKGPGMSGDGQACSSGFRGSSHCPRLTANTAGADAAPDAELLLCTNLWMTCVKRHSPCGHAGNSGDSGARQGS